MNNKVRHYFFTAVLLVSGITGARSQDAYWQQQADYKMDIDFDVTTHRFTGTQLLTYTNNSPDTLRKAYYHLYFNAFQPGSMMDVRNRNIEDPSSKIGNRIMALGPEEIGYLKVNSLKQDGKAVNYETEETILTVRLASPILPGQTVELAMEFDGQVPLQIRRSGRFSSEGIEYSMSQWYPKLSEYDRDGWHPNPYIAREFYGVWGDYDVKITIDASYVLAASAYLQNPNQVGYGYQDEGVEVDHSKKKKLTWHFKAETVHDFMWAADPDYTHTRIQVPDGPMVHFFYQEGSETRDWKLLPEPFSKAIQIASKVFGEYPYREFHYIQGGDGGMEYPMSTLITGHRRLGSLMGTGVHELMHSWYQGILGTDEAQYPWMDEGFTEFASNIIIDQVLRGGSSQNPHQGQYNGYVRNVLSGNEQPMTMHSDMYHNNRAYSRNAYSKGAVYLHQLGYVIGQDKLLTGLRRYFNEWKFRHPTPADFIRIMERVSDMELDWYQSQFVNSTNFIDYAIDTVMSDGTGTKVELRRNAEMMMPIDLYVKRKDGSAEVHYIPLRIMYGEKENEYINTEMITEADWPWTHPTYSLSLDIPLDEIETIIIDPTGRMADVEPLNNYYMERINIDK